MAQNDKIAKLEDLVQFWKQIIRVSDTVATKYFIIDNKTQGGWQTCGYTSVSKHHCTVQCNATL